MDKKLKHYIYAFLLLLITTSLWSQKSDSAHIKQDTVKVEPKKIEPPKPEFVPNPTIQKRLSRIQRSVPLPLNKHVQDYIDFYTNRKPDLVAKLLGRSEKYFPIFEPILRQYGVPDEIKNLALVESALNPTAVSPKGAKGPWQFMPSAAKRFNLNINSYVDERKDPYLSTEGACRYLKYMYNKYGDWLLAIASYNCGDGNVDKAIKIAGSDDFWDIKPYLPKETQNYVPAFIASCYFMSYYSEHGISPEKIDFLKTTRVQIKEKTKIQNIESWLGVPKAILYQENPSLLTNVIPDGFFMNIPKDKYDEFVSLGDSVYLNFEKIAKKVELDQELVDRSKKIEEENAKKKQTSKKPVVTKPKSDTIKKTVQKPVKEEKKWFGKKEKKPEQQVKKPEPKKVEQVAIAEDTLAPMDENLESVIYTVKDGDNLGAISGWFQMGIKDLKKWNGLTSNNLVTGQELLLFTPKSKYDQYARLNYFSKRLKDKITYHTDSKWLNLKMPEIFNFGKRKAGDCNIYHTIQNGESLWIISQKYPNLTVEQMMEWNKIDKKTVLKVGSQIIVGKKKC
ncbi:MAG: transglycosylase SLT domain-containing protein [Chitinophagales bacterium]|nr:transglycosylase SLT domain-containing protein [Chitinophagales bacterium]